MKNYYIVKDDIDDLYLEDVEYRVNAKSKGLKYSWGSYKDARKFETYSMAYEASKLLTGVSIKKNNE